MLYTVPIAFSSRGVSLHFQDAIMWLLSTSQLFLQAQCSVWARNPLGGGLELCISSETWKRASETWNRWRVS